MNSAWNGPSLRELENRLNRLEAFAESRVDEYARERSLLRNAQDFIELVPKARARLEDLSTLMFGSLLDEIESNLTHAIREVLGQDRVVATTREVKNNRLQVHFQIRNEGEEERVEDILHGQGGSVCNIFSVGLRLIALSQLPEKRHRPFLVLDEQDCWLRPALVPVFMNLIAEIAERLDLQVLVISHHPVDLFAQSTKRILCLRPDKEAGARIEQVD